MFCLRLVAFGICGVVAGCDTNLDVKTRGGAVALEAAAAEPKSDLPAKLTAEDCFDPDLNAVSTSVSLTLCNGEKAQGLLDLSELKPEHIKTGVAIGGVAGSLVFAAYNDCTADGAVGCVTTNAFKAADMANVNSSNIKTSVTIAGIAGNVTPSPAACASDGASSCVVDGTNYKAAKLANFANSDVKSGITIAGVAGSLSNCTDGGTGCVVQGPTFKAVTSADLAQGNIKSGAVIGGITGNYGPACGSDGAGSCLVDGTNYKAALLSNFTAGDVKTGVTIAGVPGSATLELHSPCGSDGATDCVANASYKAADMSVATAGNIKTGVTVAGVAGDYPSATYRLTGADGTADLDSATFNAKIKSSADFEWFDSTGARYTNTGDTDIKAGLLLPGVSIFGTVGTYTASAPGLASFDAVKGTGKVTLSWGASGSGVIIVRRAGAAITWSPYSGTSYSGAVDGNHSVVYAGTATTYDDTSVSIGTTYYYMAYAYNADYGYSTPSAEKSVFYVDTEVCGGAGDDCYSHSAAIAAGIATTPGGKSLTYTDTGDGFFVWKETSGNRILRANGLDEWAKNLNLNGKGLSATDFTDYASIVGRQCPPNVYIDDANKFTTGNCLYYTATGSIQRLDVAGTSQVTDGSIGLNNWSNYNGGGAKWYVGNIQTCAAKGMRLPTIFETATTDTTQTYYPTADGSPTFAQGNGIPTGGSWTWTASAKSNALNYYWVWSGASADSGNYDNAYLPRCVLP